MTDYTPEPDDPGALESPPLTTGFDQPEPPRPVNWNLLTAHDLEQEWSVPDKVDSCLGCEFKYVSVA